MNSIIRSRGFKLNITYIQADDTAADGELFLLHRFSRLIQFPDPNRNYHGRKCSRCNLVQFYGSRYGSLNHPSFDDYILEKFPTCDSYIAFTQTQQQIENQQLELFDYSGSRKYTLFDY